MAFAESLDNLPSDVRTTAADNEALWRVRALNGMDPHEDLRFLLAFTAGVPPSREISASDEPFTL